MVSARPALAGLSMSSDQSNNPNYKSRSFQAFLADNKSIIYYLYGPAGSGKSWLLEGYRQIANQSHIVASLDRIPQDEVDAMQQFVTQISRSTSKLDREVYDLIGKFNAYCEEYRQLKQAEAGETTQEEQQQEPSLSSLVAGVGQALGKLSSPLSFFINIWQIIPFPSI